MGGLGFKVLSIITEVLIKYLRFNDYNDDTLIIQEQIMRSSSAMMFKIKVNNPKCFFFPVSL